MKKIQNAKNLLIVTFVRKLGFEPLKSLTMKNYLTSRKIAYTSDLFNLFKNKRLGYYAYSTQSFNKLTLDPNFITGFSDAEGCFLLQVRNRNNS